MIEKIEKNDRTEWFLNGVLHREDGPAKEMANGRKEWWINGKRHRDDGPAIECADGSKHWYLNNKRHREDGPAREYSNGRKEWFLNGVWIYDIRLYLNKRFDNCVGQFLYKNDIKYLILCFECENYYFYTVLRGFGWDVDGKIFYCSLEELKSLL